jgi:nucleoside-diphosphate-sugar epimerase
VSTVFVSGPTGCIGAATLAWLLDHGADRVIGFSRTSDWSRIDDSYRDRISLVEGDITDASQVRAAIESAKPDRIIHLAAFQTPDCQAMPFRGLDVNVTGTANMLRAAAELGSDLQRFVFASSAAVYGPRSIYPGETVTEEQPYLPPNLYGYWKTAGEGMAQAFHMETGVPTVSLRLATTYGPGRDKGLTSAPTSALKAAAVGDAFAMPYQGREHYHFVTDVGAGFAESALRPYSGYGVFNLRGRTVDGSEFLTQIREVAVEMGLPEPDLTVAPDAQTMPFVCDMDDSAVVQAFPEMPLTPIRDGIRQSLERFCKQSRAEK